MSTDSPSASYKGPHLPTSPMDPPETYSSDEEDSEFWEKHLQPVSLGMPDPNDHDGYLGDLDVQVSTEPCPECGATDACAWDSEGRPLIHAVKGEE